MVVLKEKEENKMEKREGKVGSHTVEERKEGKSCGSCSRGKEKSYGKLL